MGICSSITARWEQFDGSKVCSETGKYHYSYASAGAQRGTDYNLFITSSS